MQLLRGKIFLFDMYGETQHCYPALSDKNIWESPLVWVATNFLLLQIEQNSKHSTATEVQEDVLVQQTEFILIPVAD